MPTLDQLSKVAALVKRVQDNIALYESRLRREPLSNFDRRDFQSEILRNEEALRTIAHVLELLGISV